MADNGVLTWQDCLRLALRQNPDLISAAKASQASRAQYRNSFNAVLPRVSLSNSYTESDPAGGGDFKTWQLEGTAALDLININSWASIQSAGAAWQQSEANRQRTSSQVLLNLYRAFGNLLYAQEEYDVASHIRDLWTTNARMIRLRYESGRESKGNTLRTDAEVTQSDAALAQALRDRRIAQRQLAQALGQTDFSVLIVTGTWSLGAVPATSPVLDALVEQLPGVRAQAAVVSQSRAAVRAAESVFFPSLSLRYNRGTTGGHEFPQDPYWSWTGVVSLPLFSGGLTSAFYSTQAAERTYEKSQEDLRSVRNQARTDLETAWSGLEQARDQVRVQEAFLVASTQRKQESDIMYQSGLMSFQDWQTVTNDYVNSQRSILSAQQNVLLAEGQWRFASGEPLGDSL